MFNVVYFVCMINNWEDICKRNAQCVISSGIIEDLRLRSFTIVCTGEPENVAILQSIFSNSNVTIEYKGSDTKSHEFYGIYKVKELSNLYQNDKLLYFHSKGVTRGNAAADWVLYLEYFNIIKYNDCLEKLDTYDVVGTEYLKNPRPHISGNFWWSTPQHISKLNVPNIHAQRHSFEFFILNTQKPTSIWNFHNSIKTHDFEGFNKRGRRKYILEDYEKPNNEKSIHLNYVE